MTLGVNLWHLVLGTSIDSVGLQIYDELGVDAAVKAAVEAHENLPLIRTHFNVSLKHNVTAPTPPEGAQIPFASCVLLVGLIVYLMSFILTPNKRELIRIFISASCVVS